MQTLIIILIVVLIAETIYSIYLNFVDHTKERLLAATTEQAKNAYADYSNEKIQLRKLIDNRDDDIRELIAQRGDLHAECEKLKNALSWRPSTDQIKSVYAAAGILSSMNEKTDSDRLMALWTDLKAMHQCYKIGVDVGGGDGHSPEPPSFEESQGESGTNKA
ncbi:MAG: hypothetical protein PUC18_12905 [Prevotellaceae bacterium]|nr:hypothetical protein [Prevotellaceae bacterium]